MLTTDVNLKLDCNGRAYSPDLSPFHGEMIAFDSIPAGLFLLPENERLKNGDKFYDGDQWDTTSRYQYTDKFGLVGGSAVDQYPYAREIKTDIPLYNAMERYCQSGRVYARDMEETQPIIRSKFRVGDIVVVINSVDSGYRIEEGSILEVMEASMSTTDKSLTIKVLSVGGPAFWYESRFRAATEKEKVEFLAKKESNASIKASSGRSTATGECDPNPAFRELTTQEVLEGEINAAKTKLRELEEKKKELEEKGASKVTVVVDGKSYTSCYDEPGIVSFGCARISRILLVDILNAMNLLHAGNRELNEVKIGKGYFTKADIEKMVKGCRPYGKI
jgi:hypothetical protein